MCAKWSSIFAQTGGATMTIFVDVIDVAGGPCCSLSIRLLHINLPPLPIYFTIQMISAVRVASSRVAVRMGNKALSPAFTRTLNSIRPTPIQTTCFAIQKFSTVPPPPVGLFFSEALILLVHNICSASFLNCSLVSLLEQSYFLMLPKLQNVSWRS